MWACLSLGLWEALGRYAAILTATGPGIRPSGMRGGSDVSYGGLGPLPRRVRTDSCSVARAVFLPRAGLSPG